MIHARVSAVLDQFIKLVLVVTISGLLTVVGGSLAHNVSATENYTNLVSNGDVETPSEDEATPEGWQIGRWGENTIETYYGSYSGYTNKAVGITVTDIDSGDAKWYFDEVPVEGGETYVFQDDYYADVDTKIFARFTLEDGTYQYQYLGTAPETQGQRIAVAKRMTAPATATSVTIFHSIDTVGELRIDNAFVAKELELPAPIGDNLIPNHSAEVGSLVSPIGWFANSFGENETEFTHSDDAFDGNKSLQTSVSNYVDGDAKWYTAPIAATPSAQYVLSNFSKSTTDTAVHIRFMTTDGSIYYQKLGDVNASADWQQNLFTFKAPENAAEISIFHVISSDGDLWVDNYELTDVTGSLEILNHDAEVGGSAPAGWSQAGWGDNTRNFTYINGGYEGSRSLRLRVSDYVSGDAKWLHTPVALTAGEDYTFSNAYKSDVTSKIILLFTREDGSVFYHQLEIAPSSDAWTTYSDTFTMPYDAETVSAMHVLTTDGYLVTDNYEFSEYTPEGFDRGIVTFTFDDGWDYNYRTAIPMLEAYGWDSTQFYATHELNRETHRYWWYIVRWIEYRGHEIGSHTVNHPDLATLSAEEVAFELEESDDYLESIFKNPINYFATPFGSYDEDSLEQIMDTYTFHRTVNAGYNSKDNWDISQVKVQNVLDTTTPEEVEQWVQKAKEDKTWLVLVLHRVVDDPLAFDTTPETFAGILEKVDESGIEVATVSEALAELEPQLD